MDLTNAATHTCWFGGTPHDKFECSKYHGPGITYPVDFKNEWENDRPDDDPEERQARGNCGIDWTQDQKEDEDER